MPASSILILTPWERNKINKVLTSFHYGTDDCSNRFFEIDSEWQTTMESGYSRQTTFRYNKKELFQSGMWFSLRTKMSSSGYILKMYFFLLNATLNIQKAVQVFFFLRCSEIHGEQWRFCSLFLTRNSWNSTVKNWLWRKEKKNNIKNNKVVSRTSIGIFITSLFRFKVVLSCM